MSSESWVHSWAQVTVCPPALHVHGFPLSSHHISMRSLLLNPLKPKIGLMNLCLIWLFSAADIPATLSWLQGSGSWSLEYLWKQFQMLVSHKVWELWCDDVFTALALWFKPFDSEFALLCELSHVLFLSREFPTPSRARWMSSPSGVSECENARVHGIPCMSRG